MLCPPHSGTGVPQHAWFSPCLMRLRNSALRHQNAAWEAACGRHASLKARSSWQYAAGVQQLGMLERLRRQSASRHEAAIAHVAVWARCVVFCWGVGRVSGLRPCAVWTTPSLNTVPSSHVPSFSLSLPLLSPPLSLPLPYANLCMDQQPAAAGLPTAFKPGGPSAPVGSLAYIFLGLCSKLALSRLVLRTEAGRQRGRRARAAIHFLCHRL